MTKQLLMKAFLLTVLLTGAFVTPALAVPELQLDILNGNYYSTTQSIIAGQNNFKLYAYLGGPNVTAADLAETYYISAAIVPKQVTSGSFGTFKFNSNTYDVTADMTYGVPPIDMYLQTTDPNDLSSHNIFNTYFREFSFTFNSSQYAQEYDTAVNTGGGPSAYVSGNKMYYVEFTVNDSQLLGGRQLHFDLYSTQAGKNGPNDVDVLQNAPYSHDATSCGLECTLPEPTSLLLIGSGLASFGLLGLRRRKED